MASTRKRSSFLVGLPEVRSRSAWVVAAPAHERREKFALRANSSPMSVPNAMAGTTIQPRYGIKLGGERRRPRSTAEPYPNRGANRPSSTFVVARSRLRFLSVSTNPGRRRTVGLLAIATRQARATARSFFRFSTPELADARMILTVRCRRQPVDSGVRDLVVRMSLSARRARALFVLMMRIDL